MKTFSKALLCILLASLWGRPCSAGVLLYNYSQQVTMTQAGASHSIRQSGQMLWDQATTNVAVVTWATFGAMKSYFIQPATNYVVVPISGPGRGHLTAMSRNPPAQFSGGPTQYLGSPLLGRNSHLKIGTDTFVDFPSVFAAEDTTVAYDPQDASNNSLTRFKERYVFSPSATQSANNHSQSLDDVLNALVQSLQAKGYSGQ